jgi:hypothetical protein
MNGVLLGATIENITTRKDNTVKIVIGTQELSQGKAGEVFNMMNKLAAVYISAKDTINQNEIDQVDKIDPELESKSQSKRIRNTLFVLFQQGNEGFKDFDSYYKSKTEKYIEHLKSKIL